MLNREQFLMENLLVECSESCICNEPTPRLINMHRHLAKTYTDQMGMDQLKDLAIRYIERRYENDSVEFTRQWVDEFMSHPHISQQYFPNELRDE
jgi:hypothetical protein